MEPSTLFPFLLVLGRMAGFFAFIPLPGGKGAPNTPRVVLALGFTLALYPHWPALTGEPSMGWLTATLLSEVGLGISAGLVAACLAEALLMTMQIAGLQAGYGYASTIDPTTQADASILLVFAQLVAGLLFFAFGLDREILRAFARNFEGHPVGTFAVTGSLAAMMARLTAEIFSSGLRLALPVVALLTLVDLALALVGRLNSQLQLVLLAFPVKMLATLAALAALGVLVPRLYGAAARNALSAIAHLMGS
jgi:flagellar biosynthetic protein FliR